MLKLINLILLLIILWGILFGNKQSLEKFDDKETDTFEVPEGNSNTDQTIDLTRSLMITGSQSNADAEYDNAVGDVNNINPPQGTS